MRNDMTSRGAVKEVNGDHQKHRDKEQNVQEDFTGCSRLSHVILSSIQYAPQAGARPPAERYATGRRPRNGRREG